jgi:hypothetical protein
VKLGFRNLRYLLKWELGWMEKCNSHVNCSLTTHSLDEPEAQNIVSFALTCTVSEIIAILTFWPPSWKKTGNQVCETGSSETGEKSVWNRGTKCVKQGFRNLPYLLKWELGWMEKCNSHVNWSLTIHNLDEPEAQNIVSFALTCTVSEIIAILTFWPPSWKTAEKWISVCIKTNFVRFDLGKFWKNSEKSEKIKEKYCENFREIRQ